MERTFSSKKVFVFKNSSFMSQMVCSLYHKVRKPKEFWENINTINHLIRSGYIEERLSTTECGYEIQ